MDSVADLMDNLHKDIQSWNGNSSSDAIETILDDIYSEIEWVMQTASKNIICTISLTKFASEILEGNAFLIEQSSGALTHIDFTKTILPAGKRLEKSIIGLLSLMIHEVPKFRAAEAADLFVYVEEELKNSWGLYNDLANEIFQKFQLENWDDAESMLTMMLVNTQNLYWKTLMVYRD